MLRWDASSDLRRRGHSTAINITWGDSFYIQLQSIFNITWGNSFYIQLQSISLADIYFLHVLQVKLRASEVEVRTSTMHQNFQLHGNWTNVQTNQGECNVNIYVPFPYMFWVITVETNWHLSAAPNRPPWPPSLTLIHASMTISASKFGEDRLRCFFTFLLMSSKHNSMLASMLRWIFFARYILYLYWSDASLCKKDY